MTVALTSSPRVRLGAAAPGGLGLPDAKPTASQLYAPRGVCIAGDGDVLIASDTGNHRVLIGTAARPRTARRPMSCSASRT